MQTMHKNAILHQARNHKLQWRKWQCQKPPDSQIREGVCLEGSEQASKKPVGDKMAGGALG